MATRYVDSNSTASAPYTSWATAGDDVATVVAASSGGDVIYVHTGASAPHTESHTTNQTWNGGSADAPIVIIAVDRNGSDAYTPQTSSYACTITNTAEFRFTGHIRVYGMGIDNNGDVLLAAVDTHTILEECLLRVNKTNDHIGLESVTGVGELNRCIVDHAGTHAGNMFYVRYGTLIVRGLTVQNGGSNTELFHCDGGGNFIVEDSDFTAVTNLTIDAAVESGHIYMKRNLFDSTASLTVSEIRGGAVLDMQSNGTDATAATADEFFNFFRKDWYGESEEDTSVTLDATYDGTNNYSIKVTPDATAAVEFISPHRFLIGHIYLDGGGASQTIRVNAITDRNRGTDPVQDDEFWIDLHHHDETSEALGKWIVDKSQTPAGTRKADHQATSTAVSEDTTNTWAGTGGFTDLQEIYAEVTLTAAQAADIQVVEVWGNVCSVGGTSHVVYVDPKIVVT